MNLQQIKIETKIGHLYLVSSDIGLQGVYWNKKNIKIVKNNTCFECSILEIAKKQIIEYLSGKRRNFKLPLDIKGTDFQKSVWMNLLKIPYGETRSYKDISIAINNPKASRAVGLANKKNPLCLIFPCHRVIASDGTLGGYSGGLNIKKKLLVLEDQL